MISIVTKTTTMEEFVKLPETKPASEFIDGEIVQKPIPQGEHSLLQGELCTTINQAAKSPKIAMAFPELRCTFGGNSIVPDISVFGGREFRLILLGGLPTVFTFIRICKLKFFLPTKDKQGC